MAGISPLGKMYFSIHGSVMPVARVTRQGCEARVEVADARYSLPGEGLRGPGVPETRLDLCGGTLAKVRPSAE